MSNSRSRKQSQLNKPKPELNPFRWILWLALSFIVVFKYYVFKYYVIVSNKILQCNHSRNKSEMLFVKLPISTIT